MFKMKKYLSYGAGVNSTALLLLLKDWNEDFETVFVNHGGDYPETYDYVRYLQDEGFQIREIIPEVAGCKTIIDYCYHLKRIPGIRMRFCTKNFKVDPVHKFMVKPCVEYLGFSAEEKHRVNRKKLKGIEKRYPLIEQGVTRVKCIEIIKEHGLKVPPRSGCYFCPFMTKAEARSLFLNHKDLFLKVVKLERECGRGYYLKSGVPFERFAKADTPDIIEFIERSGISVDARSCGAAHVNEAAPVERRM